MNSVQTNPNNLGSFPPPPQASPISSSRSYRGRPRTLPGSKIASARISYPFNPTPIEAHKPAHFRPVLLYSDRAIEQTLIAMTCAEGRPVGGIIKSISAISEWSGVSTRTVSSCIKRLRNAGLILTDRVSCKPKGERSVFNRYVYRIDVISMSVGSEGSSSLPHTVEAEVEQLFHATVACDACMLNIDKACIEIDLHHDLSYDDELKTDQESRSSFLDFTNSEISQYSEVSGKVIGMPVKSPTEVSARSVAFSAVAPIANNCQDGPVQSTVPVEICSVTENSENCLGAPPLSSLSPAPPPDKRSRKSDNCPNSPAFTSDHHATEHQAMAEKLRELGVWSHGIKKILSVRTVAEITSALCALSEQVSVSNPAGWLYGHLVVHWNSIQEAKASASQDHQTQTQPSEADLVREREWRPPARLTTAELDRARQLLREREQVQARTEQTKLAQQTELESQIMLKRLSEDEYSELYARSKARFGGRPVPEAWIIGGMLGLIEQNGSCVGKQTNNRQASLSPSRNSTA